MQDDVREVLRPELGLVTVDHQEPDQTGIGYLERVLVLQIEHLVEIVLAGLEDVVGDPLLGALVDEDEGLAVGHQHANHPAPDHAVEIAGPRPTRQVLERRFGR